MRLLTITLAALALIGCGDEPRPSEALNDAERTQAIDEATMAVYQHRYDTLQECLDDRDTTARLCRAALRG